MQRFGRKLWPHWSSYFSSNVSRFSIKTHLFFIISGCPDFLWLIQASNNDLNRYKLLLTKGTYIASAVLTFNCLCVTCSPFIPDFYSRLTLVCRLLRTVPGARARAGERGSGSENWERERERERVPVTPSILSVRSLASHQSEWIYDKNKALSRRPCCFLSHQFYIHS